jgi:hypothetical protein
VVRGGYNALVNPGMSVLVVASELPPASSPHSSTTTTAPRAQILHRYHLSSVLSRLAFGHLCCVRVLCGVGEDLGRACKTLR